MTAFLKIDGCKGCRRSLPWEWVPAVLVNGKNLAGTGVWRSQLQAGLCHDCVAAQQAKRNNEQLVLAARRDLVRLLGGEKPYREFVFDRYQVEPGNRTAFERCRQFMPSCENLYLWGPCGVGKTHLALAAARRGFEETLTVTILAAFQLSRRVRMKEPAAEQAAVDELASADILVLDDVGSGSDTAYSRQVLQEILEKRNFQDRAGLIVTSPLSLDGLAARLADDAIPSRLAGMCSVVEIRGADFRLTMRQEGL